MKKSLILFLILCSICTYLNAGTVGEGTIGACAYLGEPIGAGVKMYLNDKMALGCIFAFSTFHWCLHIHIDLLSHIAITDNFDFICGSGVAVRIDPIETEERNSHVGFRFPIGFEIQTRKFWGFNFEVAPVFNFFYDYKKMWPYDKTNGRGSFEGPMKDGLLDFNAAFSIYYYFKR